MGMVFISNHVLEVKCVIISLLFLVGYDFFIYNKKNCHLTILDISPPFLDTLLVLFSAYKVSYNYYS